MLYVEDIFVSEVEHHFQRVHLINCVTEVITHNAPKNFFKSDALKSYSSYRSIYSFSCKGCTESLSQIFRQTLSAVYVTLELKVMLRVLKKMS